MGMSRKIKCGTPDERLYIGDVNDNMEKLWNHVEGHDWSNINVYAENEISVEISKLCVRKDPGPMLLPASIFKDHQGTMSKLLAPIFTACSALSWLPDEWSSCYITPIPKKGEKTDIKNYRGIAMQSVIPKIFDAVTTKKIQHNIEPLLNDNQHGFRRQKGTLTWLLEALQYIDEQTSPRARIDAVFVDYAKAFDRVSHAEIVRKLAAAGASLNSVKLIMKLVMGRRYYLKLDGEATDIHIEPKSAVPQGSHIGPVKKKKNTVNPFW